MSTFNAYSHYYDLLYKDKDYREEVNYLIRLLEKYGAKPRTVIELGCGTGIHASLLQQRGFHVTGIDKSTEMLNMAKKKLNGSDLKFIEGNIMDFRNDHSYDAAISLFHVISYMPDTLSLRKAFETAEVHLTSRGLFVFDCWHGPAVLSEQPSEREKIFEDTQVKIIRRARPEWLKEKKLVNVNYEITVTDKQNAETETINETHAMRYWFENEIEETLNNTGFELLNREEWLSGKFLSAHTWNACYVARKLK